jgi:hypothetical protein
VLQSRITNAAQPSGTIIPTKTADLDEAGCGLSLNGDRASGPVGTKHRGALSIVSTMTTRRFPAPWRAEKMPGGLCKWCAMPTARRFSYVYSRANQAEAMQAKLVERSFNNAFTG